MPTQTQHQQQVIHNLNALSQINNTTSNTYDWQVTITFYAALHIIQAYLASRNLQYKNHVDVFALIDPGNPLNIYALPSSIAADYKKLSDLSRKARYLIVFQNPTDAFFAKEKHLTIALRLLDNIMAHFANTENYQFPSSVIVISDSKQNLQYFT